MAKRLLFIEGVIGGFGNSGSSVARAVRNLASDDELTIKINSPGGYVTDGMEIYEALAEFSGKKTVILGSEVASMASIIAMAGDEIVRTPSSTFMVHNVAGTRDERPTKEHLKLSIDMLTVLDARAESIYLKRFKGSLEDLRKMLTEETWIGGDDLEVYGFADRLATEDEVKVLMDGEEVKLSSGFFDIFSIFGMSDVKMLTSMADSHNTNDGKLLDKHNERKSMAEKDKALKALAEEELEATTPAIEEAETAETDTPVEPTAEDTTETETPADAPATEEIEVGDEEVADEAKTEEAEKLAEEAEKKADEVSAEIEALKAENAALKAEKEGHIKTIESLSGSIDRIGVALGNSRIEVKAETTSKIRLQSDLD